MAMFPKPKKGSGTAARRARKKKLDEYRRLVDRFCLEADGYVCQICGVQACHAHHCFGRGRDVDNWREQPDSRLSNCNSCHDKFHARGTISKEEMIAALEVARERRTLDFEVWLENH